jgi:diguanylate cyclase (GGDEF)-like protein
MTRALWTRGALSALALWASTVPTPAWASAPPPLPAPLADRLRQIQMAGYERPEEALKELRAETLSDPIRPWVRYTEARIQIGRGQHAAARALFPADSTEVDPLALHVRALVARREGQVERMGALVEQAMTEIAKLCPSPPPADANALAACPVGLLVDLSSIAQERALAQGQVAVVRERGANALAWARSRQNVDLQAQVLIDRADAHLQQDESSALDSTLSEALALPNLSPIWRVRILNFQAGVAGRRDQRDRQGELLEQALVIAQSNRLDRTVAILQGNLSDFHVHKGRPQLARQLAEQALPVLQRFEDPAEATVRHNLALALIDAKVFDAARVQLARLQEIPVMERPGERALALRELSDAWARAGQYKEALALYHAERKLTAAAQAQARELALEEVRQRLGSAQKEAELTLAQREADVTRQTLANQDTLRQVAVAAGVLLVLCLGLGGMFWVRARAAFRKLRRNQRLLKALSERDALTGLANRRQFHQVMAARGEGPLEGSLVIIDIDHFKRINDGHGHAAGDAVIQAMAQRLSAAVRDGDMVVRWGGEEYLVYAPTLKGTYAKQWVSRLMPALCGTPVTLPDGKTLDVTCSMGFITLPIPPLGVTMGWERALNWADLALYAAKNRGRRRALGIVGLHVSDEVSLAQVKADFEGAASAARLSLVQVLATPADTTMPSRAPID